ncbi:putative HAD superfamily hydrolase [Agrobacterium vitis]|nr:putative HAD superfamily hydrolase [Agrobacterium vitis]
MLKNVLKFSKAQKISKDALSKFFDEHFYRSEYQDLEAWKGKLLDHYVAFGVFEGRNPNRFFDQSWYAIMNPDVDLRNGSALLHYIEIGEKEGRWPHPLFNPRWYIETHSDVAAANVSPLMHFLTDGMNERREFSPFFDLSWYRKQYPEVEEAGVHPVIHFLEHGKTGRYNPNPYFSSAWYLADNPDVRQAGVHPYMHFLRHGRSEGRLPMPHILNSVISRISPTQNIDLNSFSPLLRQGDFEPARANVIKIPPIDHSNASVLSFDVWSTLIHRDCDPDEIKLQSARLLLLKTFYDLKPGFRDVKDLFRSRLRAENKSAPNGDYEYRFVDAIPLWLMEVLQPHVSADRLDKLAQALIEHEFRAEQRSTHRDENMSAFINEVDKPLIFTSDFYLSSDCIAKLLAENRVSPLWMKRYASADTFENKRSGKLFQKLLTELDLQAPDILHIGDNPTADRNIPASMGIQTFLYENPQETARMRWYREGFDAFLNDDKSIHRQRILALLEMSCNKNPDGNEDAELFNVGVRLSVIAFSFCLSVLEDALARDASKVFFFTREGLFFQSVYDTIVKEDPYNTTYPASHLLPVSRRATFAASLKAMDTQELMRLWSMYSHQSLKGLTNSLNLDEEMIRGYAAKYNIDFEDVLVYPWKNKSFMQLMNDQSFIKTAEKAISEQRNSLSRFLEQSGFKAGNGEVIVVDIGWRGTIQDNLAWMSDIPMRGHYLALFKFLNVQHPQSSKSGWLGDVNQDSSQGIRDQVAPLEMLFNGGGGSVVGYKEAPDGIKPVREIIDAEERVIERLAPLQNGMLSAVERLAEYARLHGLMANDFRDLARDLTLNLLDSPPTTIADLFAELSHNETFGTGTVDKVGGGIDVDRLKDCDTGRALHANLNTWLKTVRWPEGAVRQTNISQWWNDTPPQLRAFAPLPILKVHSPAIVKLCGNRLAVYAPSVLRASGGHRTIFNVTRRLASMGMEPYIFLDGIGEGIPVVEEYLAGTGAHIHTSWTHPVAATVAFATIAHSAQYVAQSVSASNKFYLVQDAEALFNPMGDTYIKNENSYAQGLNHITIGNWLTHVVHNQYGAASSPAGLGVDNTVYHKLQDASRENAVCMLYQPDKPRRGNQLALDALRLLKKRHPDVKIYMFGSNEHAELDFEATQLGVITDLSQLNVLYNKCKAGICISLSNPSRIPFEMIEAGCTPVDVYRYNNLMDFDSDSAILAYQNPSSIALALEMALQGGIQKRTAEKPSPVARTLDWENDAVAGHVLASVENNGQYGRAKVIRTYSADAVISKEGDIQSAQAFCAWQRHLADL